MEGQRDEAMKLIILNTIDEIRNLKKKRPGKDKIIKHACKEYGLSEKDAAETLRSLESKQAIRVEISKEGNDSYFICQECQEVQMDNSFKNKTQDSLSGPDTASNDGDYDDSDGNNDKEDNHDDDNDVNYPTPLCQNSFNPNTPILKKYGTARAKSERNSENSILTMANSISKMADTISELHQMLRIERAKVESLMNENFSVKKKNQELEILMENILGSQAKENNVPSTPTQKTLEIRSNLINEAEHNKHRKGDKKDNNTGIHKERRSNTNECSLPASASEALNKNKGTKEKQTKQQKRRHTQLPVEKNKASLNSSKKLKVMIAGDSQLKRIDETKLCNKYRDVEIRA